MDAKDVGRFVWYDLMTTDMEGAKAFYGETIGYKLQQWEHASPDKPYSMICVGDTPDTAIGGIMTLPEEAAKMGAPPHWLAYVAVEDAAASLARVKELGGQPLMPEPMNIPKVGTFAPLQDPGGAVIALFTPEGDLPGHEGKPRMGDVSWRELMTDDLDKTWAFYEALFGWEKTAAMDMGEMGTYQMYGKGETSYGGMMVRPKEMPVSAWAYYLHVDGIDAAIKRCEQHGAKLMNGPMEVPGEEWVAQFMDPQGAMFAIHSMTK